MAFATPVAWEYRLLQQGRRHEIMCSIHQARDCTSCCQHCFNWETCPKACPNIRDTDPICFCKIINYEGKWVYIYELQKEEICRNVREKMQ